MNDGRWTCACWRLPTPTGTAPLAMLSRFRQLRLTLNDGRQLEGELDWAFWRRPTGVQRMLELSDEREAALLGVDEVAMVEILSPPVPARTLAVLVERWIENWQGLTLDDPQYWDLVVGDHELLEVSIKRSRLACQPGGGE